MPSTVSRTWTQRISWHTITHTESRGDMSERQEVRDDTAPVVEGERREDLPLRIHPCQHESGHHNGA